ncbi:hypothetical protein EJB05_45356, partial [Eragrostis curvula]
MDLKAMGFGIFDMVAYSIVLIVLLVGIVHLLYVCACRREPVPELEQRAATALVAEQAAPPVEVQLPYFPYAAQGRASETLCAICVEPLRQGQLCSEVTACRHAFHRECLGEWAKRTGSCPLCRAKIVPGSDEVAVTDDIV